MPFAAGCRGRTSICVLREVRLRKRSTVDVAMIVESRTAPSCIYIRAPCNRIVKKWVCSCPDDGLLGRPETRFSHNRCHSGNTVTLRRSVDRHGATSATCKLHCLRRFQRAPLPGPTFPSSATTAPQITECNSPPSSGPTSS